MPTRPAPPDAAPQYLAEGVPKQGDETLRELQSWIAALLEFRQEVAPEEIEGDDGEEVRAVEERDEGTVVVKEVSCGKENCKCQRGELHGPYEYVVRRQGEDLSWEYVGPVE